MLLISDGRCLWLDMDIYDSLKVQPLAGKMPNIFLFHQTNAFCTEWHWKIPTLFKSFKIHRLLFLVILFRTWPGSQTHDHCNASSLCGFNESLILCAQSCMTADAGWAWMKTSTWKTILLPCFIVKISQSRKDTTAPLKMRDNLLYSEATHSKASLKALVQTFIEWY